MKPLLLLLLLSSWTHLGSDAQICDTGVAFDKSLISIEGSRKAGAEAYFIKSYPIEKLKPCLEECCGSKFGSCSVAAFTNSSAGSTCLHFYCEPLSKCKFFPNDLFDSFAYPPSATTSRPTTLEKSISTVANLLKDYERSVTARKGAENIPLNRKGVSKEDHILDGELIYQDDNTTIKPRKGVNYFSYIFTTPLSNVTVIKPTTYGDTIYDVNASNTKPKIIPRKGVEPFLLTPTSVMSSTNPFQSSAKIGALKHEGFLQNKDLISILQNVFTDDINVTEFATEVPNITELVTEVPNITEHITEVPNITELATEVLTLSEPSTELMNVTQLSNQTPELTSIFTSKAPNTDILSTIFTQNNLSVVVVPTVVSPASVLSTVPQNSYILEYTHYEETNSTDDTFSSTTELSSSIFYDQSNTQISSTQSTSVLQTLLKSEFTSPSQSAPKSSSPTLELVHGSLHPKSGLVETVDFSKEQHHPTQKDIEDKYQSSMHLVFALVFGLLVLFGVMGTIVKRIYDVWVRRHYRRMDFLIDGMYDGYT